MGGTLTKDELLEGTKAQGLREARLPLWAREELRRLREQIDSLKGDRNLRDFTSREHEPPGPFFVERFEVKLGEGDRFYLPRWRNVGVNLPTGGNIGFSVDGHGHLDLNASRGTLLIRPEAPNRATVRIEKWQSGDVWNLPGKGYLIRKSRP